MAKMNQQHKESCITLIGLGPGDPGKISREAWDWLSQVDQLYLKTSDIPIASCLPGSLEIKSFDHLFEEKGDLFEINEAIVDEIMNLSLAGQNVSFGVLGHPMIDDLICPEIAKQCQDAGLSVRIIGSMSLVEHTIALLNVGFLPQLIITNASKLLNRYTPGFSPSTPVLITQISTLQTARNLKKLFTPIYHDDHPVILVVEVGTIHENIVELTIDELDTLPSFKSQATLFIPPISTTASFEAFQEVIARLRAPDGCPWDRAQTHTSLKPFLLEEAYETLDALDREDISDLQEELGDLMLQILLHAQIACEEGNFNIHDVLEGIATKLIRRHPHVFAEVDVADVSGVIRNWEAIKAEERLENSDFGKKGLLDGVPIALPALLQAQEIVERLRRVGFDLWTEIDFVNQIHEMTKMFNQADQGGKDKIMGEMLILLTSAAQLQGIDAESVLRQSLTNFRQRFSVLESHILESGRTLADITVDEKKKLWSTLIDDGGHTE